MVRQTTQNYEVSSESGRERHVRVPYARLEDATPTLHDPAAVLSVLPGTQLTGTVVTINATDSIAILNVADGAQYWHNVRNVITYNAGNEQNFQAINIGDPVFYDRSNTMPAFTYLSTSPLDRVAAANALFGHVVLGRGETAASYPKGAVIASTQECAIEQV